MDVIRHPVILCEISENQVLLIQLIPRHGVRDVVFGNKQRMFVFHFRFRRYRRLQKRVGADGARVGEGHIVQRLVGQLVVHGSGNPAFRQVKPVGPAQLQVKLLHRCVCRPNSKGRGEEQDNRQGNQDAEYSFSHFALPPYRYVFLRFTVSAVQAPPLMNSSANHNIRLLLSPV